MGLDVRRLAIPDVLIIRPTRHADARGYFTETYNRKALAEIGIDVPFVQDNHSHSTRAGTVRGLHYQAPPCAQAKLVRVVQGRILDIAVDIRRSSPTFGQWVAAEISAADGSEIFVPVGFAHGICTLEPDTAVLYKVSDYYSPAHDLGIRWNDPAIGVTWPIGEADAILSDKDRSLPFMRDADLF